MCILRIVYIYIMKSTNILHNNVTIRISYNVPNINQDPLLKPAPPPATTGTPAIPYHTPIPTSSTFIVSTIPPSATNSPVSSAVQPPS